MNAVNAREQRALVIAATSKIVFDGKTWVVPSQTSEKRYSVSLEQKRCNCLDHTDGGFTCKHILAAEIVVRREFGQNGSVTETRSISVVEKKTVERDWTAYNQVQYNERHRVQVLLHDLVRKMPEPEYKGGRRPKPISDILFATCFKVYSTLSSRRFGSDLQEAHEKGYLSASMHPNKVNTYLEDPSLAPALKTLITKSSLPLRAIETDFALDSSGFSVSRFVRWFDEKYGAERSGRDWCKVHVACGVRTHIVTGVEIHERDAADCPQFVPLVNATSENFKIGNVSGDKAYLSHENLELVERLGGTPFVPFKSNSVQGEAGTVWEKMFLHFQYRRDEFLKSYHQRSQSESVFSMVKAKFGDSIRSRKPSAQVNECLAKFVMHNLTCLLHAQAEMGIDLEFWSQKA